MAAPPNRNEWHIPPPGVRLVPPIPPPGVRPIIPQLPLPQIMPLSRPTIYISSRAREAISESIYNNLSVEQVFDITLERDMDIDANADKDNMILDLLVADRLNPAWLKAATDIIGQFKTDKSLLAKFDELSFGQLAIVAVIMNFQTTPFRYDDNALRAYLKLLYLMQHGGIERKPEHMVLFTHITHDIINYLLHDVLTHHPLRIIRNAVRYERMLNHDPMFLSYLSKADVIEVLLSHRISVDAFEKILRMMTRHREFLDSVPLQQLYHYLHGGNITFKELIHYPVHPMERLINDHHKHMMAGMSATFDQQLMDLLGIEWHYHTASVVSEASMKIGVILNNLPHYAHILTRGNLPAYSLEQLATLSNEEITAYLNKLKDREIIDLYGAFIPYNILTRRDSIEILTIRIKSEKFFIPWHKQFAKVNPRRSINSETTLSNDVTDATIPMIGYGTLLRYTTYELAELEGAFHKDDSTGIMAFRRPDNYKTRFTLAEIKFLAKFIRSYPEATLLSAQITKVFNYLGNSENYVNEMRLELAALSKEDQALVLEFLRSLFVTGMYMRRWRGPGHPYPYSAQAATCNLDPEAVVRNNLIIGNEIIGKMSHNAKTFVNGLRIINFTPAGEIEVGDIEFSTLWNGIVQGTACIRIASTKFLATAQYYREKLFNEITQELVGHKVELIL